MKKFIRPIRSLLLAALLVGTAGIAAQVRWVTAQEIGGQAAPAQQIGEGPNRAALVVSFGDGTVQSRCVAFPEASISGEDLLVRSGLAPVTSPEGAVCALNDQGCPPDDCFCACPFPDCEYWAYYHWQGGNWVYSNIGAFAHAVTDGALEGWSWGQGDFTQAEPPPVIAYEDICPAAAPATATPTATATQQVVVVQQPAVTFQAGAATLAAGQCTTLSWQVQGAVTILLDGSPVSQQGSRQVCPPATQRYTLIAANSAGQSVAYVDVQVSAPATATPIAVATAVATATATSAIQQPPAPVTTATRVVPPAPQPPPGAIQPLPTIFSPPTVMPAAPVAAPVPELVGGVPLAPTAQPAAVVVASPFPTPTRFVLAPLPTETPRPRRQLGADGRATPTPILPAAGSGTGSAAAGAGPASSAAAPGALSAADRMAQARAFDPDLLPGYAAYALALAFLAGLGWFVMHRKNGHRSSAARRRAGAADRPPDGLHELHNEQAGQLS